MLRDSLRPVRNWVDARSTKQHVWLVIIGVVYVLSVIGFVNLAPVPSELKIATIILIPLLSAIFFYIFIAFRPDSEDDLDQVDKERDQAETEAEVYIPPKPPYPPIGSEAESEATLAIVMRKILNRLEADAMKVEQEKESGRKAAEAKAQLLLDKTVYVDDPPEFIYYLLHGLWKTLLALTACILLVVLFVNIMFTSGDPRWWIAIFITILAFVWYAIRCYGDWIWTRRQIIGNQVIVLEPANGFFFMFGGKYSVSILDCGNVFIRKSWYERIFRLPSATVSIDTRLKDKEKGDSTDAIVDVFKSMRNTRNPEKFRETIIRRHDELTLGQPGIMRRFDQ